MPLPNHSLSKYVELCLLVGLPVRVMSVQDCFLAAGEIIHKTSLQRRGNPEVAKFVENMSASDLSDLRASIHWQESVGIPAGR
jgi:hypothetical protein